MSRRFFAFSGFATTLLCSALAGAPSAQVSLASDQPTYAPGATAVLMGAGFQAGEEVTLVVLPEQGTPTGPEHDPWTVTADSAGAFQTGWVVCDDDCIGLSMLASANGPTSGGTGTSFLNHDCGDGVVTSLTPLGGACVDFTPAVGMGPDNYEVQEGGLYSMTISGVTECAGSTITVFVQGSSTGNFCFNAVGGGGTYTGTFTMPDPACNTYPVSYKCGADAACNHPGSFKAQGPTSGCGGVHLRASNFDGGCNATTHDTDCSGGSGCTPCVLTCPPDVDLDCSESTDPASTGSPTGCSGATFTDTVTAGSCAGSYVITRHWSAPDGCPGGNVSTCDQTITVSDTTGPDITCPPDVMLDCSASTDPADTGSATAMDDCSGVVGISFMDATTPGNCAGNLVITRTWTATDGCGNSSSCDQTLTVSDTTGPAITCPPDVAVDCADPTDPGSTGSATAMDDCSGVVGISFMDATTPGDCAASFVITRTWTATDGCGNSSSCDQTITVSDTTGPDITCPPNAMLDCSASTDPADTGSATAMDDCSGVVGLSYMDAVTPGNCAGNLVITRTWTATDGCGNSSSCDQFLTVTDTTAPTLGCPPDVTVTGCCVSIDLGLPTASDDCSNVTVSNDAPESFCLGDTIVTWTATDDCGNSVSCQQVVTVLDITLDFEGAYLHGQNLVTPGPETPFTCPSITGGPDPVSPGNGNNGAAIFDSTNGPFGQDPDLNVDLGNILYLQRNGGASDLFTGLNGPDTWDHPNDDEDGGTLTFDFCTPIQALAIDLIDIDLTSPDQDATVTLTDGNGFTRTYQVPGGWTANGPGTLAVGTLQLNAVVPQAGISSVATVSTQGGFDEMDIVQIRVRLGSSGAIDNLRYCPSGPKAAVTARNGSGVNPSILSPASMPVIGATWSADLDCGTMGGGLAVLSVRRGTRVGGMSPSGETLIGGDLLYQAACAFDGPTSRLSWTIPYDMSLVGLEVHVQGLCQTAGARQSLGAGPKVRFNQTQLSNALDLRLGF